MVSMKIKNSLSFLWRRTFLIYIAILIAWIIYKLSSLETISTVLVIFFAVASISFWIILMLSYSAKKEHRLLNGIFLFFICLELIVNLGNFVDPKEESETELNSGFGYFNHACASFDSVRGFRWLDGAHRIVKFTDQAVLYDNTFKVNNQNYYSKFDYCFEKHDSAKQRFMILGDSFTASEFLDNPVADYLTEQSSEDEFYSFSVNGGGLDNWHSIFFKEIVPNYDFDAVVLNVFANDLKRDFFMMHHFEDQGFVQYSAHPPESFSEYLEKYHKDSKPYAPILSDLEIDALIAQIYAKQNNFEFQTYSIQLLLFGPVILYEGWKWKQFLNEFLVDIDTPVDMQEIEDFYGIEKIEKLNDIISYCKQEDKKLIFSSVPYEFAIYEHEKGKMLREARYLQFLANANNCVFYDGYTPFYDLNKEAIAELFFQGDTHWNQEGAMLFANNFLEFVDAERRN